MALIKCSDCGHEVSSNATTCPNCGAPITPDALNTNNINESGANNSNPHKSNKTTKIVLVAVAVLAVILILNFVYTMGNASRDDYSTSYSSSSTVADTVVDDEPTTTTTETVSTSANYRTAESSDPNNPYVGVWKFTDKNNNQWVLTIKGDETAEVRVKGSNECAYASWYKYKHMKYASFSCSDKGPRIMFPGTELKSYNDYQPGSCGFFCVDGEYIYENSSAADAKNPEMRLPITKED